MLDVLGRGYVADCCIAAYKDHQARESLEIYVTEALSTLINMLAGKVCFPRYYDLMHPAEVDARTAEEIIDDVIKRNGLTITY